MLFNGIRKQLNVVFIYQKSEQFKIKHTIRVIKITIIKKHFKHMNKPKMNIYTKEELAKKG